MRSKHEKERSKRRWIKRFFIGGTFYLLLALGLGLLLSPLLESSIITNASRQFTSFAFTREQLEENIRNTSHFQVEFDIAIPELPEILENLPSVDPRDVIGVISIERVGVFLPIFHGATKVNLLTGAGTMHYNQVMGEGNYPLAGHHMRDPSLLFGPLLEVNVGDLVQLSDRRNLYTYRVSTTGLVHENSVDILEHTDVPIVTLFTCDSSTAATNYRFVVIGELIDITSLDRVGTTADGGLTISSEDRRNPYLVTFQVMNQMSLNASRQDGTVMWIIKVAGVSFVLLMLGMFLFIQIEKRYRHIYER